MTNTKSGIGSKYDVKDKVVLVTGANRGIGKAIVDSLIKHGVKKVYAAVRNLDTAQPLIEAYGDKIIPIHVDMEKPETIKAAATTADDVEVLINNAGILELATPLAVDAIEKFNRELNVNVFGLIHVAQAFAPILKANGGGALVQLNSTASLKSFSDFATYSASKAAAYSITQGLRDTLDEQGTLVVSVHPGPIETDMTDGLGYDEMTESPTLVSEAIVEGLSSGQFHIFPDTMAKQIGEQYESFAKNIIEANLME